MNTLWTAAVVCSTALLTACSTYQPPTAPTDEEPVPVQESVPEPAPDPAPATARYRITFDATWSGTTHPEDFPGSAHFSSLIGGTHKSSATFWREGVLASDGIKDMAEGGRITPLDQEVETAIAAGTAERVLRGGAISRSPGSTSFEFEISQAFPLVTLVTMVAPSPDWFAGVSGLALFENEQWVSERRIELDPWDAGTDSGPTFSSPNQPTVPRQPISRIQTSPLSPGGRVTPLGTFTFTRLP